MALVITAGTAGATGNAAATGPVQVVAGGAFNGNRVQIELDIDGVRAPVYDMDVPGCVSIDCVSGTTVHATVAGTDTSAINVSIA
jgi:hypothetical protein